MADAVFFISPDGSPKPAAEVPVLRACLVRQALSRVGPGQDLILCSGTVQGNRHNVVRRI